MTIQEKMNKHRIYLLVLILSSVIHNLQQEYYQSDYHEASLLVKILLLINLGAFIFTAVKVIGVIIDLFYFHLTKMEIQKEIDERRFEENRLEQEKIKDMVQEIISREDGADETT
jgi:hypothetical protein